MIISVQQLGWFGLVAYSRKPCLYNLILACCLALLTSLSYAMPVSDLYSVSLPVSDRTKTTREAILPQALYQVLVKLTGKKLAQQTSVAQDLPLASQLLQRYRYTFVSVPGLPQPQLMLEAHFALSAVNQLLQKLKLSVWGRTRPLVLVWLTAPQANQTVIANAEIPSLASYLQWQAKRRGIPIVLPNLDLADLSRVTVTDVSDFNLSLIKQASIRYNSNAILLANLRQIASQQWQIDWQLILPNHVMNHHLAELDQATAITHLFDDLADELSKLYATPISARQLNPEKVNLTVAFVNNLDDYSEVSHYLKSLTQVHQLKLMSFTANTMQFELSLNTTVAAFNQALVLDHQLVPSEGQATTDTLYYQWTS